MKKVLITQPIHEAGMEVLAGKAEVQTSPDPRAETVKGLVSDVEGIILRTTTFLSREIIDAAPNLRVISRTGVGVSNVDTDAATEKGILVCNTPGVNAPSVAEHVLALLLALAKQIKPMDRAVREGNWKIRNSYTAVDLDGKTLGLVGLGRIGRMVAEKCRLALNMRVIGYDPFVGEAESISILPDIDAVFRQADCVSIHVPYTEHTHHLVNGRLLNLMKPDSYLINTSRGEVVDEKALTGVLENGTICGAGLDVFEEEPPSPQNPLFNLDNVVSTPHSAALSRECVMRVAAQAAQAVVDVFSGGTPDYIFNRAALENRITKT